jgi:hypothetical protein
MLILDNFVKMLSIKLSVVSVVGLASAIITVSSAYYKAIMLSVNFGKIAAINNPSAACNIICNTTIARINNMGNNGSP